MLYMCGSLVEILCCYDCLSMYVFYRRKGPAGAGRRGEDGEWCIACLIATIGGRGRAGAGRWKKTGFHGNHTCYYVNWYAYSYST